MKHAGPDRVTVPELQQRFEEAEDAAALFNASFDRVAALIEAVRPPIADLMADVLADEDLFINAAPYRLPDGPPYWPGEHFYLGDRRGPQDDYVYDLGDHIPPDDPAQQFRDRIAQIRPLIHEITKET